MIIKIYINKIKRDLTTLFTATEKYMKEHGCNATFEYEKVDVKGLSANNGILVGANALVETSKADINMFIYGKETFPNYLHSYTVVTNNKPFCYVSDQGFEETEICLPHEILHALASIFGTKDVMDTYYKNTVAQYKNSDSNFEQQWKILKPFLSMPTATLTRTISHEATYGNLEAKIAGAIFKCHTLELGWKDNKNSISCIPKGTYKCIWSRSLKFPMGTYEVLNVPNRSGIRIHKGNYALGKKVDIEGCILLGSNFEDINGDKKIDIVGSTQTVEAFQRFMGKKDFTLIVK